MNAFTITSQCHIPEGLQVSIIFLTTHVHCCERLPAYLPIPPPPILNNIMLKMKCLCLLFPLHPFRCMILMVKSAIIVSCSTMAFRWRKMLTLLDFARMRYSRVAHFLSSFQWCCVRAGPKKCHSALLFIIFICY